MNENSNALRVIELSEGQNHRCAYCTLEMTLPNGEHSTPMPPQMATKEHVIPKSIHFDDSYDNVVVSCSLCNVLRGNMDHEIFLSIIQSLHSEPVVRNNWHHLGEEGTRLLCKIMRAEVQFLNAPSCKATAFRYVHWHSRLQLLLYRKPWSTYARIAAKRPLYTHGLESEFAAIRAVYFCTYLSERKN